MTKKKGYCEKTRLVRTDFKIAIETVYEIGVVKHNEKQFACGAL